MRDIRRTAAALALASIAAGAATAHAEPAAYAIVGGAEVPEPLTASPGDGERGAAIAADPDRGGCLSCHGEGGDAAPARALAAGLSTGAIRLAVIDLSARRPALDGHAWYDVIDVGAPGSVGETRLSAQEVEDVIAWLLADPAP